MWKILAATCLSLPLAASGQLPETFHWVDFKQDTEEVVRITRALTPIEYTAIREIGITGDSALVFTTSRDSEQDTPAGDGWDIYSLSMKNGQSRKIMGGYKVEVKGWFRFSAGGMADLAITYLNCWECEPTSMFTALHYDPDGGWRARWLDKKYTNYPGMSFLDEEASEPYTDYRVDQVFAVFAPENGLASAGTWYRSTNLTTGRVTAEAYKYFVDPITLKDKALKLNGLEAQSWARRICSWSGPFPGFGDGQDSASCKLILRKAKLRKPGVSAQLR